jgi:hypothetical protein
LFGELVGQVHQELAAKANLLINRSIQQALAATDGMVRIERAADADIAEARESAENHAVMREATRPLSQFLDFWHALRWLQLGPDENAALDACLNGMFGPPVPIIAGLAEAIAPPEPAAEEEEANLFGDDRAGILHQGSLFQAAEANRENYHRISALIERCRAVAAEQHFLHWQVAFPGVWDNWTVDPSPGGFDVVVGNPPWDRIKLQEVEWFAARRPEIAHATTAAERKRLVAKLVSSGDPLAEDYEVAKAAAETAARIVRDNGQYPLLSGGDINIYALFVERASRLVNAGGIIGLLVPSGIAADKSCAPFFHSTVQKRRLKLLLDFFNKKYDGELFFPDVYYRFKFAVFVFGGPECHFPTVSYGCFLRDLGELARRDRVFDLSAADIRTVNPNTGTAPIFRTARDAEITTALYRQLPGQTCT